MRPAAESHGSIIEDAIPWEGIGTNFITQFTEGRKKSVIDKKLNMVFGEMEKKLGNSSTE